MAQSFEDLLSQYNYDLPESFIAQEPAEPRDSAKLLVYDRKSHETVFDTFRNLPQYLPRNAVLVFNQTKVLPARFVVQKPTGGKVSCLYIETVGDCIKVMVNKPLDVGVILNPFDSSLRADSVKNLGEAVTLMLDPSTSLRSAQDDSSFKVIKKIDRYYLLKPSFPIQNLYQFLDQYGETPIPPYIKHSHLSEADLREKYQTVFAKETGSVAAPTASLHFTDQLMDAIRASGIDIQFVTLHVNLGTFASLTEEHVQTGKLHTESYFIDQKSAAFLNNAKKEKRPIIAVGTTVVRTLESAADDGQLSRLSGATDLFIREGYQFMFIDSMITNFHVPKSSLLMLVAAFVGRTTILDLYEQAKQQDFKFFSFGDGMLLR